MISIHAPREGGDPLSDIYVTVAQIFQSTPPARGATVTRGCLSSLLDISIHAPREGGDADDYLCLISVDLISIHAPREGGDSKDAQFYLRIFDK